jgi:hypothetical protein
VVQDKIIPEWAPRVPQRTVRRFYETDALGVYDQELIEALGYALRARCQSFIEAVAATNGKARCPVCGADIAHTDDKAAILQCACGWELTWGEYFKTIQHKQLSGAEPVLVQFRAYVDAFPKAQSLQEKTLLIDRLIHGFHWYIKTDSPTRPVAINLIEGRLDEVVAFLDGLTYSERSTPGTRQNREAWEKNVDLNRGWYPSRRQTNDDIV